MKTTRTCSVDGCDRPHLARGLCNLHYQRARTSGEVVNLTLADRLAAGFERKPNGCLEWTGYTDANGYGRIGGGVTGSSILTHRLAWGLAHPGEPMPPVVRHFICDNPPCGDPAHLRPGTKAENSADMVDKGRGHGAQVNQNSQKTHCPQRHEYTEANTYVTPAGTRRCQTCHRTLEAARRVKALADKVRAG